MYESEGGDRDRRFAQLTFRLAVPQEVWKLDRAGLANGLLKLWVGWLALMALRTATSAGRELWERQLLIYQFDGKPIPQWPSGADWQVIMPGIVLVLMAFSIPIALGFGLHRLFKSGYCQLYELGKRQTWLALDGDRAIARADIECFREDERRIVTRVWVEANAWWQGLGTETVRTYVQELSPELFPL
ncbi:MAG: hypothetical protein AAFY15_14805, partial [Cyanobacteria bacterium J06648_11]